MHFQKVASILALAVAVSATLAPRQQSEIDFAGDIPDQCYDDDACNNFINTAATCERDLSVRFTQDDDYLDCVCEDKSELKQCYKGCVADYKKEGDIKKVYELCSTNRRGGRRGRGGRGGRGRGRGGYRSDPEDWQDNYDEYDDDDNNGRYKA